MESIQRRMMAHWKKIFFYPWLPVLTAPGLHQKVFEAALPIPTAISMAIWFGARPAVGDLILLTILHYKAIEPEWLEIIARDVNHPAIIGWCPFNETWDIDGRKQDDAISNKFIK